MEELFRIETDKVSLVWSGPTAPLEISTLSAGFTPGRLSVVSLREGMEICIQKPTIQIPPQVADSVDCHIGPHLFEETTYQLLLKSKNGEEIELQHRDLLVLGKLSREDQGRIVYGYVNFGGQIGRSRFKVTVSGTPEFDFEVEVFPSKLDYTSDYEALLADLQGIITALVLSYLQSTYKMGKTEREKMPTKLEWVLLLRHILSDLERGLRYIERHPERELARMRVPTRVERLRKYDSSVLQCVLQGKGEGRVVRMRNGIPLRYRIPESRAMHTLDTQEHRWLAAQLSQIRRRLAQIYEEERERQRMQGDTEVPARKAQILDELKVLKDHISRLEEIEPIAAAAGQPAPGFASLRLQQAPGYREAYHACIMLRRGLRVDEVNPPLSLKQLHILYEYWCFLSIVNMVSEVLGVKIPVERLLTVQQSGVRIQLQKGRTKSVVFPMDEGLAVEVAYNPIYSGDSYALPQEPDIVITLHNPDWPKVSLILDAKYRIDSSDKYLKRFGVAGPPQDAINVLHRYRDAILEETGGDRTRCDRYKRNVVEGVVLYPYAEKEKEFANSRLWQSLKRLGIGALPFLPSEKKYVEEWLRSVLRQAGWSIAERAIPHVAHEKMRTWREASKEVVLVGTLRRDAKAHLDWIIEKRRYYTPLTSTQRLQFAVRWLAIYSPASLRKPGAVSHFAQVERIDVLKRKDIVTPWPAEREGDELQVVYYLEEVRELNPSIENRGANGRGIRFSRNRWTSLLALQRAEELRELFLETEPEWRLYDGLRAAGINFSIYPGQPLQKKEEEPKGRASFLVGELTIQYRGSAGFSIKHPTYEDNKSSAEHVLEYIEKRCGQLFASD
ncbi:MAG: DUF2357 domain-containing protein [Actinobacteria bacterium]|nr:DUF2357 domain-containing protein [Actinomycetota bacterium]